MNPHVPTAPPTTPTEFPLATRMSRMSASAVREILKVTEKPDILSFAGGLPAPDLFPLDALARAHADVLANEGAAALQYSITEGYLPLREWLCARLARRGIKATLPQVLITNGSQQGIDLVGKVLLDAGDTVVVENPCYLAALQTFGGFEVKFAVVGSDDDGMRVEELEALLQARKPKLIYVVADFHNPKGSCLSLERRERLVHLARTYGVPILEDDPYGELRFRKSALPPLASFEGGKGIIYLGTFSKTLAPGLRLGWVVGPPSLMPSVTIAKQAADLHSSTLSQRAAAKLLETFDYDGHIQHIRAVYAERCEAMVRALEKHMPRGTSWVQADGGLFLWVRLPTGVSGEALFAPALKRKVAYVPGSAFFVENPEREYIRLNYSNRSVSFINEGMERLGALVSSVA